MGNEFLSAIKIVKFFERNKTEKDFLRILKIKKESGFKAYVGIEYDGNELIEVEGIKVTKALLEKVSQILLNSHQ